MQIEAPAMMVLLSLREDLVDLSDKEAGELLRAMLDFAAEGQEPSFRTAKMRTLWRTQKRNLAYGQERYGRRLQATKYANYCKKAKQMGFEPMYFEAWREKECPES